ncbi:hypothetical protein LEP1GSC151_3613 [Leptospira interrogans serovar Grippotyphosa str. LT2186]|uniref:Uncharacterized protein n=2 Tax=Leptospira interrogans TaxID=173 RepID=M3IC56_LEPIR|nr:hypothetical protein LEP1GSC151_3613 [Leptospira interrogans serovar Grippotyphosa str. LT2186]
MTEAESPVRAYAKETLQYDANGNLTRQRDNVKDLTKRISIDSQDRITKVVTIKVDSLMSNPEESQKVIETFMQMTKFDIQKLINA